MQIDGVERALVDIEDGEVKITYNESQVAQEKIKNKNSTTWVACSIIKSCKKFICNIYALVEVKYLYFNVLLELVIGYIALFIIVKFLGKTQLNQITPFDFISALVMGDLVGSAIFNQKVGILAILFAIAVWGALIFISEMLTQKSRWLRYVFEGRPSMIINNGNLDWKEMKKNKIDIDQLKQLLRFKDIFSIQDVDYAILENNGGISVLRKSDADQPTCKDLKIKRRKKKYTLNDH